MLHNPKRVKRSKKHAKKTEMRLAFERVASHTRWMKKLPKSQFRYKPPE